MINTTMRFDSSWWDMACDDKWYYRPTNTSLGLLCRVAGNTVWSHMAS